MAGAESWSARGAGDGLRLRDHRDGRVSDPGGIFQTLGLYGHDPVSDLGFDPRRQQVQIARAARWLSDLVDLLPRAVRDCDWFFAGEIGRDSVRRAPPLHRSISESC